MNILNVITVRNWVIISLINFFIVGCLGLLMRVKFLYPFFWIDQMNLLHSHSHFAFTGWITTSLIVFFFAAAREINHRGTFTHHQQLLLLANLLISYGMLISFAISGYSVPSIVLSFLSVVISYWVVYYAWKLLSKSHFTKGIRLIFKAAFAFNLISSLGTFALIFLKASHNPDVFFQTSSINFYLHFQYNGWFLFCCLGLFLDFLYREYEKEYISVSMIRGYLITVFPTYFLSINWLREFSSPVLVLVFLAVIGQLAIWIKLIWKISRVNSFIHHQYLSKILQLVISCVGMGLVLKLTLQGISLLPGISEIVYGFRPIVVAYLHLVLLVVISMFLVVYSVLILDKVGVGTFKLGICVLLIGVWLNEGILAVQGLSGIMKLNINGSHHALLILSACMVFGIGTVLYSCFQKKAMSLLN
ncbi:hypothetical protein [Sphingobacterium sp. 1.A.5]|uniref:hypothetical protein n=1 Tax=Sphingobacterium sp. 1.A.5 TaxID=2044604 RepID=UPI000C0BC4FF|nr:hypothetical protein [Sphingobacterium sp. 1.A.5]